MGGDTEEEYQIEVGADDIYLNGNVWILLVSNFEYLIIYESIKLLKLN